MDNWLLHAAMKAQLWEEGKGKLRALVAVKGSVPSRSVGDESEQPWEALSKQVEAFISTVEDYGLHE